MQATISDVPVTLVLAGVIVGRWWMLIVGAVLPIIVFLSRPNLILPGPEFFAYLALRGASHAGIGLLLRQAGRAVWRMMVAAWMRFVWPKLDVAARSFLIILRAPIRAAVIVNVVWPWLYFGVFFFWNPPLRGVGPIRPASTAWRSSCCSFRSRRSSICSHRVPMTRRRSRSS